MGNSNSLTSLPLLSHASNFQIAELVTEILPTFPEYKEIILQKGVDGPSLFAVREEKQFIEFLAQIGIKCVAHRIVLFKKFQTILLEQESREAEGSASKTQAFLSHDWGKDHMNHEKVSRINKALVKRGIRTWFDEVGIRDNIWTNIAEGIENTESVIVFITQNYYNKVNGREERDSCKLEFSYAAKILGAQKLIPVVMERGMSDPEKWRGEIGLHLNRLLFIDMSSDDEAVLNEKCDELKNRIDLITRASRVARADHGSTLVDDEKPHLKQPARKYPDLSSYILPKETAERDRVAYFDGEDDQKWICDSCDKRNLNSNFQCSLCSSPRMIRKASSIDEGRGNRPRQSSLKIPTPSSSQKWVTCDFNCCQCNLPIEQPNYLNLCKRCYDEKLVPGKKKR